MAKPKALPEGKESQFGRKTKRTPELEEKIFEQLQLGCTRRAACAVAGISEETFYCWMREIPEFSELVVAAENQAEAGFTNVIQKAAAAGDWKAAESWLKRRRREDWADNTKAEVSGPDGGPVPMAVQFVPYVSSDSSDS